MIEAIKLLLLLDTIGKWVKIASLFFLVAAVAVGGVSMTDVVVAWVNAQLGGY